MSKRTPNPAKVPLRIEIAARIAALTPEEKKRQSQIVFKSTDQEIDTRPLINHIQARGATAFVPQYASGRMRMLRLEVDDERNMILTRPGIAQHSKDQIRDDALETGGLDLIISPGVAFTRTGDRLGHGSGCYDKYIRNLRQNSQRPPKVLAVGFDCQIVDNLPMEEYDQIVDEVVYAN